MCRRLVSPFLQLVKSIGCVGDNALLKGSARRAISNVILYPYTDRQTCMQVQYCFTGPFVQHSSTHRQCMVQE